MLHGFFSVFGAMLALLLLVCGVAILPALLVLGAVMLAMKIAFGVLGIVFRLVGVLFMLVFALPLLLLFGGVVALGGLILHSALPLLLIAGIVWLIVHHRHRAPPALPSHVP